jgi:hypothetical protein
MVAREGKMVSLKSQVGVISEELPLDVRNKVDTSDKSQGEENLVPCI